MPIVFIAHTETHHIHEARLSWLVLFTVFNLQLIVINFLLFSFFSQIHSFIHCYATGSFKKKKELFCLHFSYYIHYERKLKTLI